MKTMPKSLIIICLLINNGCTNMNTLNLDTQSAVGRTIDAHNFVIPIYHKDL